MSLKLYFISLITFLGIDSLWLGFIAPFYRSQIGHLMAETPNFVAAGIFYPLYVYGLSIFVINPNLKTESIYSAVMRGALFGLVTYATCDLTNFATLKDWSLLITVVDMAWGMILCSVTTLVSVWAGKRLMKQNQA